MKFTKQDQKILQQCRRYINKLEKLHDRLSPAAKNIKDHGAEAWYLNLAGYDQSLQYAEESMVKQLVKDVVNVGKRNPFPRLNLPSSFHADMQKAFERMNESK